MSCTSGLSLQRLLPYLFCYTDRDATEHLLRCSRRLCIVTPSLRHQAAHAQVGAHTHAETVLAASMPAHSFAAHSLGCPRAAAQSSTRALASSGTYDEVTEAAALPSSLSDQLNATAEWQAVWTR